jgi:S-formylglutathione hydrolase FrmB
MVAWGWSLGGYGALLLAEDHPGFVRAVAAFSPAVQRGDAVFAGAPALRGTPVGLWCGRSDGFYRDVRALQSALPELPAVAAYDKGAHTRKYWNRVTPAAFDLLATYVA